MTLACPLAPDVLPVAVLDELGASGALSADPHGQQETEESTGCVEVPGWPILRAEHGEKWWEVGRGGGGREGGKGEGVCA